MIRQDSPGGTRRQWQRGRLRGSLWRSVHLMRDATVSLRVGTRRRIVVTLHASWWKPE
jgi:hypothetical protein